MRILIADDEPNMRRTLADILSDEGHDVETAGDGIEALEWCKAHEFDVVLMDVRMPGMDGVSTFREIRRHREGVRVILMSAYSIEEIKRQVLDEGAIAFLPKPLNLQHVVTLVGEARQAAVLVVESEDPVANQLCTELSDAGYRVQSTHSPHQALELIEQIRFDVIFIDVELPSMSGLELYLAIKKVLPSSVAVMISDFGEEFESIAREAVRQTAYTVVHKPLDIDETLGILDRLRGQQVTGELRKPTLN